MTDDIEMWTDVASGDDVNPGPIRGVVEGSPVVVWRSATSRVVVLADSCPHQGTELSTGTVDGNVLRCAKHGWEIQSDGWCDRAAAGAPAYRSRELDGRVEVRCW